MTVGFPHSEISGSKAIWRLPETYRSHITSFIASYILGIHLKPLHSCKECCTPLYNFVCIVSSVEGPRSEPQDSGFHSCLEEKLTKRAP